MKDSRVQSKSVSDFPVTDTTGEVGLTSYKDAGVFHSINSVVLQSFLLRLLGKTEGCMMHSCSLRLLLGFFKGENLL